MSQAGRIISILGAGLAFGAAVLIVWSAGLPERARFTGQINPEGAWIAPEVNASAPLFDLLTLAGGRLRLTDLRGAPVILNFWATWCEPCRIEMPALEALQHQQPFVRVVGVNLGEDDAAVRAWVDALGLTFVIALDPDQRTAADYRLRGQPSTYVIGPDGIIQSIFFGPVDLPRLEAAVAPYRPR